MVFSAFFWDLQFFWPLFGCIFALSGPWIFFPTGVFLHFCILKKLKMTTMMSSVPERRATVATLSTKWEKVLFVAPQVLYWHFGSKKFKFSRFVEVCI